MDWMSKAVSEITAITTQRGRYYSNEEIIKIIAKHCPFKPDVEYWEAPQEKESNGIRFTMIDDVRTLQRLAYTNYQSLQSAHKKLGEQRRKAAEKIERLAAILRESKREHGRDGHDDPCEKVNYLDGLHACTCGADEWNMNVDAVLKEVLS